MIHVENITKYHSGQKVLDGVSLGIESGTHLGLFGPGGAGKSLLIKIICGLVDPDDGYVTIDGVDVHQLEATELADLRFKIGMLFQNYALFDFMTISENISFPLRQAGELPEEEIEERVQEMLGLIGLPNIANLYPRELSGGMKKRVSFARAVIRRPPILFYDDPSAGLDPVTSSKIFRLLRRLKEEHGTTAVVISHDIGNLSAICDQVAMLHKGNLVFHGTPEAAEDCDISIVRQFWRGYTDDALSGGRRE